MLTLLLLELMSKAEGEGEVVLLQHINQPVTGLETATVAALRELLEEKEQEVAQLKSKVLLLQAQMKTMVRKNKTLEAAAWQSSPVGMSGTSTSHNQVFKNQFFVCINNVLSLYP